MRLSANWLRLVTVGVVFVPALIGQSERRDLDAIRELNRELLSSPSLALLERRQKLVEALIRSDADSLPAVRLTAPDSDRLRLAIPGADALLERAAEWDGALELRVEDDFEHARSRTHWRVRTPVRGFELFFGSRGAPAERKPGSPIHVAGVASGASIAVERLSPASPDTVAQSSATLACSTTGPQNIAVLQFTFPGSTTYPSGLNAAYFQQLWFGATGSSLNTYWQQTSYGKTSATGQVLGPFALSQSYTCDQDEDLLTAGLQAASATTDLSTYTRLALLFPVSTCSYAGLGTIGCQTLPSGSQVASVAWIPLYASYLTDYEFSIVAHEHGHNLGLNHTNSLDYGSTPLGALDNTGTNTEYGDPFTVMGASNYYNGTTIAGQYTAEHSSLLLGWLQGSDFQEVTSSGNYTIVPYENSTGLRALRIQRDAASGAWLWVEYRQSIGVADDTLGAVPGTNVFNGALIHYEDPNLDPLHAYLVDFNPSAVPNNFATSALTPGQIWTDPNTPLRLSVTAATTGGLTIAVNYDSQCAATTTSSNPFATGGGTGSVTVTAPSGCAWSANTATSWISFTGATSGTGNGTVPFTVAANSSTTQREGYITVSRQSLPVYQAGSGIDILPANPANGAGNNAQISFSFSDPKGAGDIGFALFQFGAGSGCEVQFSGNGTYNYFYLLNDSGSLYLGPILAGTAGASLSNSQCTVYAAGSSASASGMNLNVTLSIYFSSVFSGTKRMAVSAGGSSSYFGPVTVGGWTVPGASNQVTVPNVAGLTQTAASTALSTAGLTPGTVTMQSSSTVAAGLVISQSPAAGTHVSSGSAVNLVVSSGPPSIPVAVSVSPSAGIGYSQVFTAVYSNQAGASALNNRILLFNTSVSEVNGCVVQIEPQGIYLASDSSLQLLGTLAAKGSLANSQCTVNSAGTSVVNSGNTSTASISITFTGTQFRGVKNIYLYADDSAGNNTGFAALGTFNVTTLLPPTATADQNGSGSSHTFTPTFYDTGGANLLNRRVFILNTTLSAAHACAFEIDPGGIFLINDADTALLGPLGAGATLSNSQCSVNGSQSGVSNSGMSSTATLAVSFTAAFAGAKNMYLYEDEMYRGNSGYVNGGTFTVIAPPTPALVSLTPTSGTGTGQLFTAVYSDAAGAATLTREVLVINSALSAAGACAVEYDPPYLFLANDSDSGLIGPLVPGVTLSNSQCTVGSGSSASSSGNNSTLTLSIAFSPSFAGPKNLYMFASDAGGANTGYLLKGTFTAVAPPVPSAVSITPSSGSAYSQVFTAVFSDTYGAAALNRQVLIVNSSLNAAGACAVEYDPPYIFLVNDADTALLGPLKAGATLSNSQCALNGSGSGAVVSGNNSTLTLAISFTSAFAGAKNLYLFAADTYGYNTGFQNRGAFTPIGPPAPSVTSVSPGSASGTGQIFTVSFSDPSGGGAINREVLIVNSSLSASGACAVEYDAPYLFLINDADSALLGPLTANTSLSNSQCTLYGSGSGVVNSGNVSTMTASLTFKSGFAGSKKLYAYASDTGGFNTGYQFAATYPVTTSGPSLVSLSPNSGAGANKVFTATFADPAGGSAVSREVFIVNSSLSATSACAVEYDAPYIYLVNDGDTGLLGPLQPGGSLSNSQCTLSGVGTSSVASGNTSTLTMSISFRTGFSGVKSLYLFGGDNQSLNTGYQLMGYYTPN